MNNSSDTYCEQWYIGSALWIVVQSSIMCVIVFGNLLTILAIIFSRHLSSMLANRFIVSLALSDLLVGLYIPYHMLFYIIKSLSQQEIPCIIRFIVPTFACTHSICKLLTIATDRYIAIVYPLHYNRYMTNKMAWALILGGLFVALLLSIVPIYWNDWKPGTLCEMEFVFPNLYYTYIMIPMFGFALITMFLVYIKIWREACSHAKRMKRTSRAPHEGHVSDAKSFQVRRFVVLALMQVKTMLLIGPPHKVNCG